MFKHILVPLDGSRLAESALGMAASLAKRFNATLTLIHVIEKDAPSEIHSERHLVTADEASAYLEEVSRLSVLAGIRVSTHVHTAQVIDVADSVTQHSAELAPDLIVMSRHGRGGARRLLFGAIAQQIISRGNTPVLVVRPSTDVRGESSSADWRIILAPIDGNPSHEKGLPLATNIAQAFHCRLHLLMVVPTIGKLAGLQGALSLLLPATTRVKLEMDSAGARDYLAAREEELQGAGVHAGSETSRGDPARAIVKAARRLSADLVVMGTHGRAGTDAFWTGSVAAQVVARASVPLLLVPLKEQETY
jgi:nucleotide-binding universal stress UspA family protein